MCQKHKKTCFKKWRAAFNFELWWIDIAQHPVCLAHGISLYTRPDASENKSTKHHDVDSDDNDEDLKSGLVMKRDRTPPSLFGSWLMACPCITDASDNKSTKHHNVDSDNNDKDLKSRLVMKKDRTAPSLFGSWHVPIYQMLQKMSLLSTTM